MRLSDFEKDKVKDKVEITMKLYLNCKYRQNTKFNNFSDEQIKDMKWLFAKKYSEIISERGSKIVVGDKERSVLAYIFDWMICSASFSGDVKKGLYLMCGQGFGKDVFLKAITNFFEREMLKNIYELRDDPKLICHWYIKSDLSGKWMYQGMCIGYGIPYSTQMTNPSIADSLYGSSESTYVIDQAEPNGLYSTGSTTATWVLALNSEGKVEPQYLEDAVYVTQTKIERWRCDETALPSDY